jgi:enolase-phosphatase E1
MWRRRLSDGRSRDGVSASFRQGVCWRKAPLAHTDAGDLSRFIDHYFDTNVGKKGETESYRRIAASMKVKTEEVLFVSDVVVELDAAREAG